MNYVDQLSQIRQPTPGHMAQASRVVKKLMSEVERALWMTRPEAPEEAKEHIEGYENFLSFLNEYPYLRQKVFDQKRHPHMVNPHVHRTSDITVMFTLSQYGLRRCKLPSGCIPLMVSLSPSWKLDLEEEDKLELDEAMKRYGMQVELNPDDVPSWSPGCGVSLWSPIELDWRALGRRGLSALPRGGNP